MKMVMKMRIKEQFDMYFSIVTDRRKQSYITYKIEDILFIIICGYLCGLRDEEEIADYTEERQEFFAQYMTYKRLPCASTISNVLKILNPDELEISLYGIFRNVLQCKHNTDVNQVCIDGKTIRGRNSIHIITALLADYHMSIGEVIVDEKTNEIPAVRELLDFLNLKNKVITIDAMHCQKETLTKIKEGKGDYVVQVKANQKGLYEKIEELLSLTEAVETHQTIDNNHGRFEKRTCYVLPDENVTEEYFGDWCEISKIFAVRREVEMKDEKTDEMSYYISSRRATAEQLLSYTRKHWQIESFHWIMDVVMGEDGGYVRDKNSQFCLNIIRKFAVTAVKNHIEKNAPKKKSISGNMRKCLLNPKYLQEILIHTDENFITK